MVREQSASEIKAAEIDLKGPNENAQLANSS